MENSKFIISSILYNLVKSHAIIILNGHRKWGTEPEHFLMILWSLRVRDNCAPMACSQPCQCSCFRQPVDLRPLILEMASPRFSWITLS